MPGFTIRYSPLESLRTRLLLDQYGGWHELREAGHYDIERNVTVMPRLSRKNEARLDDWALRNYHQLWKHEKKLYRKRYEVIRRANNPTFFERMIDRWRARKEK